MYNILGDTKHTGRNSLIFSTSGMLTIKSRSLCNYLQITSQKPSKTQLMHLRHINLRRVRRIEQIYKNGTSMQDSKLTWYARKNGLHLWQALITPPTWQQSGTRSTPSEASTHIHLLTIGVHFDQCVSGELNCKQIIKRINARLKFMYRQAKDFNQKIKKSLCSALIQPHFDYACSSWYSGLSSRSRKQL